MKKCPTCGKEFEDSMRFCQIDGTPLVEEEKPFDPYATIVGTAAPAAPTEESSSPAASPSSTAIDVPEEVLEIPEADPLKTMYVSDAEMKEVLGTSEQAADAPVEEITADAAETDTTPEPEPPAFTVPDVPAPSFGDVSPPPSPFSAPPSVEETPVPAPAVFEEAPPASQEADTLIQPATSPFDTPQIAPVAEWTPPPAPDASWQNQEIGANTPFQPPPAGVASGQNKTLAIISLVTGILGMTLCCGSFVVSVAAIVLGVLARSKASQNPQEYGGAGLAMGGIITGALGTILSIVFIILYFIGALAGTMGRF